MSESRRAALVDNLTHTTARDITDFTSAAQKAGLAPSTVNLKLTLLHEFFEFLREDGSMMSQPVFRSHKLLTPITLPKPMNESDLITFFKVIDSVRDRLIFLLMLRCGLRVSEVCALTWDAIDFNDSTARVNDGKGQVDRIVYFSSDVAQALKTWQAHKETGKYLFPSRNRKGSPTFASNLLEEGAEVVSIKELMGHSSIESSERYAKLSNQRLTSDAFFRRSLYAGIPINRVSGPLAASIHHRKSITPLIGSAAESVQQMRIIVGECEGAY